MFYSSTVSFFCSFSTKFTLETNWKRLSPLKTFRNPPSNPAFEQNKFLDQTHVQNRCAPINGDTRMHLKPEIDITTRGITSIKSQFQVVCYIVWNRGAVASMCAARRCVRQIAPNKKTSAIDFDRRHWPPFQFEYHVYLRSQLRGFKMAERRCERVILKVEQPCSLRSWRYTERH